MGSRESLRSSRSPRCSGSRTEVRRSLGRERKRQKSSPTTPIVYNLLKVNTPSSLGGSKNLSWGTGVFHVRTRFLLRHSSRRRFRQCSPSQGHFIVPSRYKNPGSRPFSTTPTGDMGPWDTASGCRWSTRTMCPRHRCASGAAPVRHLLVTGHSEGL